MEDGGKEIVHLGEPLGVVAVGGTDYPGSILSGWEVITNAILPLSRC